MGYGFIADENGGHEYYVKSTSVPGGYLRQGDAVGYDVHTSQGGTSQAVNVRILHWDPVDDPFSDMIDMGHPRWAETLAGLAEPEGCTHSFASTNFPTT
jgi:cold shock CspA family protein